VISNADKIRAYVNKTFVEPARRAGKSGIVIISGDVHADLEYQNRMPAVCSAIDAKKFQERYGLVLNSRTGPRQGATVKWLFGIKREAG